MKTIRIHTAIHNVFRTLAEKEEFIHKQIHILPNIENRERTYRLLKTLQRIRIRIVILAGSGSLAEQEGHYSIQAGCRWIL